MFKKGHKSWNSGKNKKQFPQLSNSGVKHGNEPWNKGLTKETDSRVMDVSKKQKRNIKRLWKVNPSVMGMSGKHHSQETKDALSLAKKGVAVHTEEDKKQRSVFFKKLWRDPSYVSKMLVRPHGVLTEEGRLSIGKASKERWKNPQWRLTQVTKINEVCGTEEFRVMMRGIQKELWKDPKYAKKVLHRRIPSYPEQIFIDLCKEFKYVGNGALNIDGKNPDFVSIKDDHKLIEIWGKHFKEGRNPQDLIDFYKARGYDCIIIWASELRYPDKVLAKVMQFGE